MAFKAGDVVRLKSGGPSMTVESIGVPFGKNREEVFCTWFWKDDLKHENFVPEAIELDDAGPTIA